MIEAKITEFLRSAHPSQSGDPAASADLFADGWMDSLLYLETLIFLEREFGRRIPPFQASRRSFQTVAAIAAIVTGAT